MPFTLELEVLDADGNIVIEEQDASLSMVRKWMVASSIKPHESRSTLVVPAAAKTPTTLSKVKRRRGSDIFATPGDSQRSPTLPALPLPCD